MIWEGVQRGLSKLQAIVKVRTCELKLAEDFSKVKMTDLMLDRSEGNKPGLDALLFISQSHQPYSPAQEMDGPGGRRRGKQSKCISRLLNLCSTISLSLKLFIFLSCIPRPPFYDHEEWRWNWPQHQRWTNQALADCCVVLSLFFLLNFYICNNHAIFMQ